MIFPLKKELPPDAASFVKTLLGYFFGTLAIVLCAYWIPGYTLSATSDVLKKTIPPFIAIILIDYLAGQQVGDWVRMGMGLGIGLLTVNTFRTNV